MRYQFKGIAMLKYLAFVAIAACIALPTVADPYKDESGKGYYKDDCHRYKGCEHKEEPPAIIVR